MDFDSLSKSYLRREEVGCCFILSKLNIWVKSLRYFQLRIVEIQSLCNNLSGMHSIAPQLSYGLSDNGTILFLF